ncbi:hypothetical protein ACJRO7_033827 [Eucalyptus globulus]|uniref:Uncharacterized protein n=1 Tax=Eucalyptus globulus TaxID=34317 RepID=A0ABD3J1R5_EUCGL
MAQNAKRSRTPWLRPIERRTDYSIKGERGSDEETERESRKERGADRSPGLVAATEEKEDGVGGGSIVSGDRPIRRCRRRRRDFARCREKECGGLRGKEVCPNGERGSR